MINPKMEEVRRHLLAIVSLYDPKARDTASGAGAYDMKVGLALYRVLAEAGMDIRTADNRKLGEVKDGLTCTKQGTGWVITAVG